MKLEGSVVKLEQIQTQHLSQQQLQNVELLQMSSMELDAWIQELALNNPLVEPEEYLNHVPDPGPDRQLLDRLRWLEENDLQNHFYDRMESDELDPIARASTDGGLEETLFRFISRQLYSMDLEESDAQTVRYLAACLDDDGYLRTPLEELQVSSRIPMEQLSRCLDILRSLEPAGVGAENLSQCLQLQLQRSHITGPAVSIVQDCLELLARRNYRAIATKLGIPQSAVQAAEIIIRELEPRPGAVFQRPEQPPYILPDIFVELVDGSYQIRTRRGERPLFHINPYYLNLLEQTDDREVQEYLNEKLHQAENCLFALSQRESTLLRCARVIVDRQSAFFQKGPAALVPLRMSEVAEQLDLHESTISRAVREKYLQCSRGVYPLSFFFTRPASNDPDLDIGSTAARTLLRSFIEQEDRTSPLSDPQLCDMMAAQGCPISRRTVTKYREAMNIPSASLRRDR